MASISRSKIWREKLKHQTTTYHLPTHPHLIILASMANITSTICNQTFRNQHLPTQNCGLPQSDYLLHMKDLLVGRPNHSHRVRWNEPPQLQPPPSLWENTTGFYQPVVDPYSHLQRDLNDAQVDEIASSMPMMAVSNQSFNTGSNTNHFSVLNTDDDDELSGEEIVYRPPASGHSNNHARSNNDAATASNDHVWSSDKDMSMCRILLRVYYSLAEIHSNWAVECSKNRKWTNGADEFENAFTTLRCGQEIIVKSTPGLYKLWSRSHSWTRVIIT